MKKVGLMCQILLSTPWKYPLQVSRTSFWTESTSKSERTHPSNKNINIYASKSAGGEDVLVIVYVNYMYSILVTASTIYILLLAWKSAEKVIKINSSKNYEKH